jgi:hypothetical protein
MGYQFVGPFPKRIQVNKGEVYYYYSQIPNKMGEAEPVENCTKETTTKFIYENIVTRFVVP